MSTQIRDFVVITISSATARVTRASFSVPMIHAPVKYWNDQRIHTYSDPSDMLDDGFLATDAAYKAAIKLMAQAISPSTFKVGRKLENINSIQTITFDDTATAGTFTIAIGAQTTAAIAYNANAAAISAAVGALTGIDCSVTGDMPTTEINIEFNGVSANTDVEDMVVDVDSLTGVTTATVTVDQYGSAVETWADSFNALMAEDNDWFGYMATTHVKADILSLAALIQTQVKMYVTASADADCITAAGTDIGTSLKALSYDHTVAIYSADAANFPDAALLGGEIAKDPGSSTWKFKTLVGITPDVLSGTAITNLIAHNLNYYETVGGINMISSEGITSEGEYADIIFGTLWLQTTMAEDIFSVLANEDKVPFTDRGFAAIETVVRSRMDIASDAPYALLQKSTIVVSVPLRANVPSAESLARYLNNVTFSALYQGAIHKVGVKGKLSV
jgi:hypothetical protein